jgi:thiol-disulfide isomerase/thioredoxin
VDGEAQKADPSAASPFDESPLPRPATNPQAYFLIGCGVGAAATILALVGVLFLGVMGFRKAQRGVSAGQSAPGGHLHRPALPTDVVAFPFEVVLDNIRGETVRFDYLEGRPFVLNFWATWCGPCVSEMPSLQQLERELAGEVLVLYVSKEEAQTQARFLEARGWDALALVSEGGEFGSLTPKGIPQTLIVDAEGRVVVRHVGAADWSHSSVVDYVRSLVPPTPEAPVSRPVRPEPPAL